MAAQEEILKQQLNHLCSIIGDAKLEDKIKIWETITTIEETLLNPNESKELALIEAIEETFYNLAQTSFLWSQINELAKLKTPEFPYYTVPFVDISNEELLNKTHDFFKNATDSRTYNIFLHFWRQRKRNLSFTNDLDNYADNVYLPYYKTAYTRMNRKYEYQDLPTMCHEYGHLIQFYINYSDNIFFSLSAFSEITSLFFELISSDYFCKGSLLKIGIISQAEEIEEKIITSGYVSEEIDYLKKINIKYLDSKNMIRRRITSLIEKTDKKKLEELFLEINAGNDYRYDVSLIIACNLYMIYLNDPEKAFYTLYKMLEINLNLSPFEYYKKLKMLNITGFQGINGYIDEINRKLKKI